MAFDIKIIYPAAPPRADVLLTYCLETFPSFLSQYATLSLGLWKKWWEHQQSQGSWSFRAAISAVHTQGIQTFKLMTWEHSSAPPEDSAKTSQAGQPFRALLHFSMIYSVLQKYLLNAAERYFTQLLVHSWTSFLLQALIVSYTNFRTNG